MDRSFGGCYKRMVLICGDSILQKGFGELLNYWKNQKGSLRIADHSCVRHSDKEESMTFKLCCGNHQRDHKPWKKTLHLRWISLRYQNYNDGQRGGNLWALLRWLSDLDRQMLDQSRLATWPCGVKRARFFSQRICWLMNGLSPLFPLEEIKIGAFWHSHCSILDFAERGTSFPFYSLIQTLDCRWRLLRVKALLSI